MVTDEGVGWIIPADSIFELGYSTFQAPDISVFSWISRQFSLSNEVGGRFGQEDAFLSQTER